MIRNLKLLTPAKADIQGECHIVVQTELNFGDRIAGLAQH